MQANGTVVAWGHDWYGVCAVPDGLSNVVAIAAGRAHSLVLKSDTSVVAWGDNESGQSTPPNGLTNVVAIATGGDHNLVLGSFLPVITIQPLSQAVEQGDAVTLTVKVFGLEPMGYQWRFNGTNIVGATSSSLTLTNVQPAQAGTYSAAVSNVYNSVLSAGALLTVLTFPPAITFQPDRYRAVLTGWTNTPFTVVADGSSPLNYQWCKNGTSIPGATAASLTLTNIQLADAGTYSVLVSNAYGSTNSDPAVLAVVFPNSSTVKYVNVSNATPVAPFSTRATAAIHIQDAILFANDRDTVIVQPGVYYENISFMGKTILVSSDAGPEVTIIDGCRSNSVVTFAGGEGANTLFSGFTVANGYALQGGGIYCTNASPVIDNCIISGNCTIRGTNGQFLYPLPSTPGGNGGDGGGLFASDDSWPIITDCVISNNITGGGGYGDSLCGNGGNGGGMSCSAAIILRTLIIANATGCGGMEAGPSGSHSGNGGNGGGIFCSSAVVLDSVIRDNTAGSGGSSYRYAGHGGKGGGIYSSANTAIEGCTILSNHSGNGGVCQYTSGDGGDGGGMYAAGGLPWLESCAFFGNSTGTGGAQDHYGGRGGNGGGLCAASDCWPMVSSCSFVENRTGNGGYAWCRWSVHSIGGKGGNGGGVLCFGGTFSDCTFQANTTGNGGAGRLEDVGFVADGGTGGDGAGMYANGPMILRSCALVSNTTGKGGQGSYGIGGNGGNGGGIWNQGGTVANCTTWGNSLGIGGAGFPSTNAPGVDGVGGGIWSSNGAVVNCILWNDAGTELAGSDFQVSYSDVAGGTGEPWFDPANCLDVDPQFVNPGLGDWHLAGTSPCINAGTNQAWMTDAVDLDGNPRISCEFVDMGAIELLNNRPVASDLAAETIQNQPLSIAMEKLLVHASDPDGDPLSVSAVSPVSTNGGMVTFSGSAILYMPVSGFVGADRFCYTVNDGRGGTATASVLVSVLDGNAVSGNMLVPLYTPDGLLVRFAGIVGRTYSVQRALAVTGPWETITTNALVGGAGIGSFLDNNPPPASAFYRTAYP